jgi:hypothetical protein
MGKLAQHFDRYRMVCALVGDNGNTGDFAAGVELDPDRLNIAANAILETDRKRVATNNNRPAAFEKQACPPLAARHQRLFASVQNKN